MTRLIDADELKNNFLGEMYHISEIKYAIDNAPTVEERPQGKGKWIKIEPETRGYAEFFRCSHCLYNIQLAYWDNECDYDYCPNCGARMEADNDSKRTY